SVRLDGAALDHWPATALARHIGYLPQHIELFDGTIAENIARLDPAAPPERIIAAARNADAHDMIQALSDGYNTRVGRGGAVLSGGHRQRIALARALYGEPCMVVLDEPNSNLDTEGEAALSQAILRLRQAGTTVIVIAHRKKGLENLNKVLVLDSGRQAVFGDKREVLQAVAKLQKTPGRRMANAS
ncbi:MAG: ATP-binding cassette domain-containing protein, partial [Pseudomonadota bacterium]